MSTDDANLNGGKNKYSKIDLDNVDSWLPEEVQRSLARMLAAQGRRQLSEATGVDDGSSDSEGFLSEWGDMPQVGREYHLMDRLGLLEIGEVDSIGASLVSRVPFGGGGV